MKEAWGPMGLRKDLHIKALTEYPVIRERWNQVHGRFPDKVDVDSFEEAEEMPTDELSKRHEETREILQKSGAHYIIDSIVDIEPVLQDINQRLVGGERP